MTIDNRKFLSTIILINLALIPVVIYTSGPIRIILGLIFVIFFPGYSLISALFPRRKDLDGIERLALSFGTSIAVAPLIGLMLNYTPWGISLYPIIICISIFIIVASAIGYFRQRKLPENERFNITIKANLIDWTTNSTLDKALSIFLLVAVLSTLGFLGYAIAKPGQGEKFSEFYIVGTDGKAGGYPKQIRLGESADIVISIINHEQQSTNYRVKITINSTENTEVTMGMLNNEEKLEKNISFTPKSIGKGQKVEFHLYLNDEPKPYFHDPLYLYIDVIAPLIPVR